MTRIEQINQKISDLIKLAEKRIGRPLPPIDVRFDLRGRSAGQALRRGTQYAMRFNIDMVNNNSFDVILKDVVPHELAHIVCMFTGADKGHGRVWRNTCIALGGTGERCHKEEVIPARITEKFIYRTTCGKSVAVGKVRHNRIQQGVVYRMPNTGGKLIPDSWKKMIENFA
jgi:predicted SprT family Zn-dependent metalloprotease